MRQERFECVPRGRRRVRLAQCFVDHRIGATAACVGCLVGAEHAQLSPARAWPSGALVQWVGNAPPEVAGETPEKRQGSKQYALHVLAPNVIVEARPERHLRLVHDAERKFDPAASEARDEENERIETNEGSEDMAREARKHTYNGKSLTLEDWTREPECAEGMTAGGLKERLRQGRTIGEALTTPKGAKRSSSTKLTRANGEAEELLDEVVQKHTRPKRAKALPVPKNGSAKPAAVAPGLMVIWYAGGQQIAASTDPTTWAETITRATGVGQ